MEFTDQVALVTGASRGIGRAIAIELAQRGARVAVHYGSDRAAAEQTVSALPGGPHHVTRADLTDPDAIEPLVADVLQAMGRIDVLINNAGVFTYHRIREISYQDWRAAWRDTLALNLIGPANLIHCVVPHMIAQGYGRIVNISSRGAFRGEPEAPAYGASKAGLNAMSQSLAKALAPHNIAIGVVAPGFVDTEMARPALIGERGVATRNQSPFGRVARPDEVALAAVFLASKNTEFLSGCIIDVNGASYLRS